MEPMSAGQRNDKSQEWAPPRQNRRYGNATKLLPDGFGGRTNAAFPPGARQRAGTPLTRRAPDQRDPAEVKPGLPEIIKAVEEMREDWPRIEVGGLYLQFRCRGGRWTLVTREDVRRALAGIECAARREFLAARGAKKPVARTPHGFWPQFQAAVGELSGAGAEVDRIIRVLRERGWQRVGRDDVTRALRRIKAANAPRHFLPGRSLPAPRQAAPGLCPSCEVPITDLGLCRCS